MKNELERILRDGTNTGESKKMIEIEENAEFSHMMHFFPVQSFDIM